MGSPVLTPARTCPLAVRVCQAQQAASLAAGVPRVNSPRMGCVCSPLTVTATFSLGPWVSSIFLVLPLPPSSPSSQLSCSSAWFCISTHGTQAQATGWELEGLYFPHPGLVQDRELPAPSSRTWVLLVRC